MPSRPQVLHIVPALFGHEGVYGGAERYALELARAMAKVVPTMLLSYGSKPLRYRDGELDVVVVRNLVPFRRFQFDPVGPAALLHLAGADVVHYHQTHTFMADVCLLAARLGGRTIVTSHLGGGGMGLHNKVNLSGLYRSHLHISAFARRVLGHEQAANATVIGGGVDTELFKPMETKPREPVLYAGRLLPHKGIDDLIRAVQADTPVILAGRPWNAYADYHRLLKDLAAGKAVRFEENCDDAGMVDLYRRALCVVLPSVYRDVYGRRHGLPELLGQTLLEGMACGAPAICTDVGAMPEVVEDGVSGFVVPPNDPEALGAKIRLLRGDPHLARRMGLAARERVLVHFTWRRVVERCLAAYGVPHR